MDDEAGFASVYDVIYRDPNLLAAQVAFLEHTFADAPGPLLDAGCGTGMHLLPLRARGWRVIGVDLSPAMLRAARSRLGATAPTPLTAGLVHGDIRRLPFGPVFGGILCLDSPLALILTDDGLDAALAGFRRSLRPGGRLVAEIYDYERSVGPARMVPQTVWIPAPWGEITLRESHHHDRDRRLWEMTQAFSVRRAGRQEAFTITHRLRLRAPDAYAAALERAGFRIREALSAYPGETGDEMRMIFAAERA